MPLSIINGVNMENAMDVYKRILMQMTWVIFF